MANMRKQNVICGVSVLVTHDEVELANICKEMMNKNIIHYVRHLNVCGHKISDGFQCGYSLTGMRKPV